MSGSGGGAAQAAVVVAVVVVAHRSADDLRALLPLLDHPALEVVVVDSACPDGSAAVAAAHGVDVVVPGGNVGWTAGGNLGAARTSAPVLAFVNPDSRPSPQDLLDLASRLTEGVASVSPSFVGVDGTPQPFCFRDPGPLSGLLLFFNAGQRLDRWLGGPAVRRRTYDGGRRLPARVDAVGAACLVVPRSAFDGFDERMWLFFSDTDWCRRARRRGLVHLRATEVTVRHEGGGSVGHLPADELALAFQRDYLAYAARHYGRLGVAVTRIGALLLVGLLPGLAALARRDPAAARAALRRGGEVATWR